MYVMLITAMFGVQAFLKVFFTALEVIGFIGQIYTKLSKY